MAVATGPLLSDVRRVEPSSRESRRRPRQAEHRGARNFSGPESPPNVGVELTNIAEGTQLLALGAHRVVVAAEPNEHRRGALADRKTASERRVEEGGREGQKGQAMERQSDVLDVPRRLPHVES